MIEKKLRIHFVGIGGAGMSGLASILLDLGYKISGSDLISSKVTKRLAEKGATIFKGHNKNNIEGADLVVISSAIPQSNPEIKEALEKNIRVIRRAEMLAKIVEDRYLIAISGTHGKTTTTSMISLLLEKGGFDPLVLIGGEANNIRGNAKLGFGKYAVAEADESDGSFLKLKPFLAVVTNVEDDHLDYYKSLENVSKNFKTFINSIPDDGSVVLCKDCENVRRLMLDCRKKYITYGISTDADIVAKEIKLDRLSSESQIYWQNKKMGKLRLNVSGYHNILNALAAFSVAQELGMKFTEIAEILKTYQAVERRMEIVANLDNKILIMDDYAHHPTEIKVTLNAVRESWKNRRIIVVFQPHRYTRTKILAKKFGEVFFNADKVIINDIYSANELPISGISGETIFDEIKKANHNHIKYIPAKDDTVDYLTKIIRAEDIIITMGAGDVWTIGQELVKRLKNK
ncbi:MAG TPA: UDP-N-acetylmuramate--L-alanine ligase [Candidatus Atribacteria bacterium]|nr:UDP-N-acetylmuramate--L-alanine ligase [Candidatus Atribacteria bacterium]